MSIQLTKIIADFDTQLAAPVSAGDTTATIVSVTDDDGNTIPNGTYGFTIDAGNSSKEYIICTLTSTALTAVYTATRQGVTTSGFARAHRRGAKVTITDWSAVKGIQNVLEVGYASATTPTTDYMLATKKYVDDASFAGATNASTTTPGVVELPVQSEVDAGTASGGAGPLVVTPDTLRGKLINDYAVDSVGTDSYAITITPAITAYTAGQRFTFKAGTANTGACTLNVCGLGAKTIKKDVSSDLATGDILANQIVEVEYDGTNMQLLSKVSGATALASDIQTFTSNGTWTKPTLGTPKKVHIQLWGGGGGGGGVGTSAGANESCGGGGGGSYNEIIVSASQLPATVAVTIGAGGAGGIGVGATGAIGATGGTSTFGSYLSAYGGAGGGWVDGTGAGGGGGGGAMEAGTAASGATGGAGGGPNGGAASSIAYAGGGGGGGYGAAGGATQFGGGGGGFSGLNGGTSVMGGGGGGGGDSAPQSGGGTIGSGGVSQFGGTGGTGGSKANGNPGTAPGGGGGGSSDNTNARTGGAGAAGQCIITTFF